MRRYETASIDQRTYEFGRLVQKRAKAWRKANNVLTKSEMRDKKNSLIKKIDRVLQTN